VSAATPAPAPATKAAAPAKLEVEKLNANYGRHQVLRDIDLTVADGEFVGVVGPNGAGKTALMYALLGIEIDRTGVIRHDGERIDGLPSHQTVKRGVSLIPTGRQLFPYMSVLENLRLGAFARGGADAADLERVYSHFPILRDRKGQLAGTLSGGEQQMLAIGRALMAKPNLLLIDEPSMGLAPKVVAAITEILTQLNREEGLSILLVEQNAALAMEITERVYVLENSRIAISGTSEELARSTAVKKSYLGL
jgi:branched-chain amino acid transport system ATP-binding protein